MPRKFKRASVAQSNRGKAIARVQSSQTGLAGRRNRPKCSTLTLIAMAITMRYCNLMKIRQRKLIGTMATIIFLAAYALIAMAVAGQFVVGLGAAVELSAFILLGVGWLPVAMVLVRWMSRPDAES